MTTQILPISQYNFNGTRFTLTSFTIRNLIMYFLLASMAISTMGYSQSIGSTQAFSEVERQEPLVENVVLPPDDMTSEATSYIRRVNNTLSETDASNFATHVIDAANTFKLDVAVLLALIRVESGFKPEVVSNHGATGLMQIIPKWHTARIVESRKVLNTYSLYEPRLNIYVGAWALRDFLGESKSLDTALLKYNGSLSDPNRSYARIVLAEAGRVRDLLLGRQSRLKL